LANDSQRFTKEFREPITQSALHVYISAVPFTPKNTLLYKTYALKLMDARVRVLRGVSSQWTACLHVLEGGMESGPIHSAIFSPEGRRIVAQYDSGFLRLWDTKTGFPLGQVAEGYSHHRQTAPHRYPTVLFSPTGKRIVSYYRTLSLWNGLNLEAVSKSLEGHEGAVTTAAISPDGVCIASGSEDRTIRLWRGSDGSPMGNVMKGHDGRINTVAFSPDGVMILSSSDDRTICIWSVSDQSLINKYPTGYTAEGVRAYPSPNGARIISTCDDGSIRLWDMLSGTIVAERRSNSPPDSGLTQRSPFSSGGFSGVPGSSSSRWVAPPPVFSSDGSRIVVASNRANRELELLDGMTGSPIGKPFVGHTDTVKFLSLSLDGKIIVSSTGSSTVRVWDVITGKPVGVDLGGHIDHVTSVSVSPNGQRLLSSSEDGTVRVWDATLRDPATEEAYRRSWVSPHMAAPSDPPLVVISGTGLQVAFVQVASVRSTLKLINATPSESSRETYPGSHDAVALSSHGRFLLTTSHEKPQSGLQSLYSLGKPKPTVYTTTLFHLGHQPVPENLGWKDRIVVPTDNSHIVKVAFSCDEKMMVLCSHPASLQLWDVAKCAPVGPVFGSDIPSHIVSVAFSPDGSRLAFALNDYTVRVWDTAAFIQIRQPLLTFKSVYSEVRFSPDGRFLVAWARDLRRCWNVQSLTEVDNDKVTIAAGIMGLKSEFGGWVESVDGRKLWWTPALNRGSFSDTTSHGHLVTNGSTGRLTVVDGTKIVEAERRRVTQSV
jgi:WD40 repeat protein